MKSQGQISKTLFSTVKAEMIDELFAFHNKGNILVDAHFRNHLVPYELTLSQLQQLERNDLEILPFHDQNISCELSYISNIRRYRSADKFINKKVELSAIKKLLQNAFAVREGSRPYPSGGALYPVEVICVIYEDMLHGEKLESGFYHYRPTLNVLQPLKMLSANTIRKTLFQMELEETSHPAFSFIYLTHVAKMLVKYQFRGYRYALMEAGAMFQQADLVAQELGLKNKLYSGFNDHEVVHLIGLDKLNFLPLIIQSFGDYLCE